MWHWVWTCQQHSSHLSIIPIILYNTFTTLNLLHQNLCWVVWSMLWHHCNYLCVCVRVCVYKCLIVLFFEILQCSSIAQYSALSNINTHAFIITTLHHKKAITIVCWLPFWFWLHTQICTQEVNLAVNDHLLHGAITFSSSKFHKDFSRQDVNNQQ